MEVLNKYSHWQEFKGQGHAAGSISIYYFQGPVNPQQHLDPK